MTSRDPRAALDPTLTISGGRDLVALVGRLVRERAWDTLTSLFASLGGEDGIATAALADLDSAARLLGDALASLPPPKNPRGAQADELRALCLAAAGAVLDRCPRPPLADVERRALDRAAGLLARGGDHRRAALAYEDLGADDRAAESWGALGDLERMEAAHEREAQRATRQRVAAEVLRRFEALLTGGERRAALAEVATLARIEEAAGLRLRATTLEKRLCRGRAITLRVPGGPSLRVAPLPTEIGRDPTAGIPLRDPAVSRRHALLRADGDTILIEDAGSRAGVRLGGVRLQPGAALPLRGTGQLTIGLTTTLQFQADGARLAFEGVAGLDRGLRVVTGVGPVALDGVLAGAEGLTLAIADDLVRLGRRPDVAVRVDGHLIGPGCDLLHGDLIELPMTGARLEVE